MKKVGVLFTEEKFKRIKLEPLFDSMRITLRQTDVVFIKLTNFKDLVNFGPYDALLHKTSDFSSKNFEIVECFGKLLQDCPQMVFIDPLDSVKMLENRYALYSVLHNLLSASDLCDQFFVPEFCLLQTRSLDAELKTPDQRDVLFPLICKPLCAQGGKESREMALVFNRGDLKTLPRYPILLQRFYNHNSTLLKVFVIGSQAYVMKRPSIRNLNASDKEKITFYSDEISKKNSCSPLNQQLDGPRGETCVGVIDEEVLNRLVTLLRTEFRMDLFGFDVIECTDQFPVPEPNTDDQINSDHGRRKPRFGIVDINPVPGYTGVPNFHIHLENLVREKLLLPKIPTEEEL